MTPVDLVIPPPAPKIIDYPGSIGMALDIVFTGILILLAGRYDATGGVLTISLLIVIAFLGVVSFCVFFTIPNNEISAGAIGGLTAAFGAIVSHWLGGKWPREPKE